ncbi:NACHT, LRR and PYD domains-containing protein 1-like [Stegastes partitus]|uniref:NACHT, LRR and PYD domains-containing protein 1-like n=1 Tax=Stegastes partitus TaxID=144197 RepID=A0A9Y4NGI6_9TELE|nr:PREDICTED: NACHT, LRR and PYD domains-containing protein 1-like [Stegastes partitus]
MAELLSATKALPPSSDVHFSSTDSCWTRRASSSVPGSVSIPSLSHITSAANNNPRRAASLPDMKLQSSFEEFTPDFSEDDEDDGSYRFQCSCPGLYQCSVTGLVFDMEAEGDVVYRTVPWNRRLLVQHHKKPAGPLFDMECVQQSVRQLHLPHCQIRPTAGSLAVAHVTDDGIKFITPLKITETHLVINITGFSAFGNVKDEDSPPDPVRALVLLFYRPPDDPDVTSILNVLLLPRNIVIRDLQRARRKLVGEERFIDASPHCKLHPDQVYTLSTAPEDDLIKVQPTETEFDEESHSSYFTSFQVILKTVIRDISLSLKDKKSSCCVWERDVCLLPSRAKTLTLRPNEKLLDIRSCFIDGTSGPVLNSLLDKLLEKRVFTDSERESADEMQNRRDKARFVVDTVRKKGDAASSEMIDFLCEVDPFLSRRLGLM